MAAVCHLGFLKVGILTTGPVRKPNVHHSAKFREGRLNRSRDGRFSFFRDGGRRHLEFLEISNF